jgi:hypothetical protein
MNIMATSEIGVGKFSEQWNQAMLVHNANMVQSESGIWAIAVCLVIIGIFCKGSTVFVEAGSGVRPRPGSPFMHVIKFF